MLTIKQRQTELKYLGFYKGAIDGEENIKLKRAYKDLQDKYFFRKKDKDGIYGNDTDKLLQSVYNVSKYTKNFDILKDKMYCHCKGKYCTGYPAIIKVSLCKNIQSERDKFGKTNITSCLRCKEWNKKQGGVSTSKHCKGGAIDFRGLYTLTLKKRIKVIDYWFKLEDPNYAYCNGYYKSTSKSGTITKKSMGVSIHGDVK